MAAVDEDVLSKVRIEPAPAIIKTRQAAREIDGQHVEVLAMGYSDRIMVNITAEGKIGHLISISLSNPLPTNEFTEEDEGEEITPTHLNPRFLLGSVNDIRGEIAQLYAMQIASLLVKQSPDERRTLLVGIGLKGKSASDYETDEARSLIKNVLEMVEECRIW